MIRSALVRSLRALDRLRFSSSEKIVGLRPLAALRSAAQSSALNCASKASMPFMQPNDLRLSGRPRVRPGRDELVGGRSAPTAG